MAGLSAVPVCVLSVCRAPHRQAVVDSRPGALARSERDGVSDRLNDTRIWVSRNFALSGGSVLGVENFPGGVAAGLVGFADGVAFIFHHSPPAS